MTEQCKQSPQLLSAERYHAYGMENPCVVYTNPDRLELFWILAGTGKYICNGIIYPVRPGDAVVCNSGTAHGMKSDTQEGFRCIRIMARQICFPGLQENCLVPLSYYPVIHRTGQEERLESLFFRILAQYQRHTDTDALWELLALLYQTIQKQFPAEPLNIGWQAVQYMDRHYMELGLKPDGVAERLDVNQYSMARMVKQMTGYTPLQYLTRRRVGAAQSLLLQTDTEIQDIAAKAGFDSVKRFSNAFLRQIGVLPQAYRSILGDRCMSGS
ncbi:MAG: AraC family transcriptional regulator [Butyricicoccus sp.]